MTKDLLDHINTFATSAGALVTAIGVIYAATQLRTSRKITKSDFLLHLYTLIDKHNAIHLKLTRKGFATEGDITFEPRSPDDWMEIGQLMGTFEYIHILIEDKILDIKTVDSLFSYRIVPVLKNTAIEKRFFSTEDSYWQRFRLLAEMLKQQPTFSELFQNYNSFHNIKSNPPYDNDNPNEKTQ